MRYEPGEFNRYFAVPSPDDMLAERDADSPMLPPSLQVRIGRAAALVVAVPVFMSYWGLRRIWRRTGVGQASGNASAPAGRHP